MASGRLVVEKEWKGYRLLCDECWYNGRLTDMNFWEWIERIKMVSESLLFHFVCHMRSLTVALQWPLSKCSNYRRICSTKGRGYKFKKSLVGETRKILKIAICSASMSLKRSIPYYQIQNTIYGRSTVI